MSNLNTKAVILAGGMGTRFHPFSFTIPKPLMPIGEEPILLHLVNQFKKHGIKNFLLAIGYHAELIKAYMGNGEKFNASVKYFKEEGPLGTAGPLSLMTEDFSEDEYFFLINGDIYTETDFSEMLNFSVKNKFDIVVGYVEKKEKSSFGVLNIEANAIKSITEKPERVFSISSGIYVLNSRVLKRIPRNKFFTMPDLINSYLSEKLQVGAYKIDKYWLGIEDVESIDQVIKRTRLTTNSANPIKEL